MSVACSLQCGVRRLPWSSFCLVFSCVQVKSEAHWGNYEKNRRWIWSPGSSWWREEMCKTKNARNPPLSSVGGRNSAPPIYNLGFANAQLVPPHPEASMLNDMLTGGAGFPSLTQIHFDHCVFKQRYIRSARFQVDAFESGAGFPPSTVVSLWLLCLWAHSWRIIQLKWWTWVLVPDSWVITEKVIRNIF